MKIKLALTCLLLPGRSQRALLFWLAALHQRLLLRWLNSDAELRRHLGWKD